MFALCECEVTVESFTEGSVIVEYTLGVVVNTEQTALMASIEEAAANQTLLASYTIDLESITLVEDDDGIGTVPSQ